MRSLLGGKGADVAEMLALGVPVPDGFTVTTEACVETSQAGGRWPDGLAARSTRRSSALEERTGRELGDASAPAAGLGALRRRRLDAGDDGHDPQPRHVRRRRPRRSADGERQPRGSRWDSYRRFVQMFGEVVEGVRVDLFEHALTRAEARARRRCRHRPRRRRPAPPSSASSSRSTASTAGHASRTIRASSSGCDRRGLPQLGHAPGTRLPAGARHLATPSAPPSTSCQMVFGNLGDNSGTGVCFTRNPSTGERGPVRRVPPQRAGRGRRRRHPHAAADARAMAERCCPTPTGS